MKPKNNHRHVSLEPRSDIMTTNDHEQENQLLSSHSCLAGQTLTPT